MLNLTIDGNEITFVEGTTVAVAIMSAGVDHFRRSVTGQPRGPLCGMGVCFECRVIINGVRHQRSCTLIAEDGMEVVTGE